MRDAPPTVASQLHGRRLKGWHDYGCTIKGFLISILTTENFFGPGQVYALLYKAYNVRSSGGWNWMTRRWALGS